MHTCSRRYDASMQIHVRELGMNQSDTLGAISVTLQHEYAGLPNDNH